MHVIEDLLHCSFPTFYKYPFFILNYKEESVRGALDTLIAMPTLSCGLKDMARKIKMGKLATPEEMAYMEGYRKFLQTHFVLYETILPQHVSENKR